MSHGIWKLPGQGLYYPWHGYNAESFNPLYSVDQTQTFAATRATAVGFLMDMPQQKLLNQ